jgi:hypothetical protein
MNSGKYKIAQQINDRGIFAEIELEAEVNPNFVGVEVEYVTAFLEGWQSGTEWKTAIVFGIQYFLAHVNTPVPHKKGVLLLKYS